MDIISNIDPDKEARNQRKWEKSLRIDLLAEKKDFIINVFTALKNNKYPDNNQIDAIIKKAEEALDWKVTKPTKSTSKILKDTKMLIDESRVYFIQRNEQNLIQSSLKHLVNGINKIDFKSPKTGNLEQLKKPSFKAYNHLISLSKLMITSKKFHELLMEIYNVFKENMDKALPKDTKLPSVPEIEERTHLKESALQESQVSTSRDIERTSSESKVLEKSVPEGMPHSQTELKPSISEAKEEQKAPSLSKSEGGSTEEKIESLGKTIGDTAIEKGIKAIKPTLEEIEKAEEPTTVIKKKYDEVKKDVTGIRKAIKSVAITEEQKDRLLSKFYEFMKDLQEKPKYHKSLDFFIQTAEKIQKNMKNLGTKTQITLSKRNLDNRDIKLATRYILKVIGRFFGNQDTTPLSRSLEKLYVSLIDDVEMRKIFMRLNQDIINFFKKPDLLDKEASKAIFRNDFHLIKEHLDRHYKEKVSNVTSSWNDFMTKLVQDEKLKSVGNKYKVLYSDVFKKKGKRSQAPKVILNLLKDSISLVRNKISYYEYVSIPRIEKRIGSDVYIVDNIVLEVPSLLKGSATITGTSKIDGGHQLISNALRVKLENIQIQAQDIAYYVKKNLGFMKYIDNGQVDVSTFGKGIEVDIIMSPSSIPMKKERAIDIILTQNVFTVNKCDVKIHNIKLKFHHNKHSTLMQAFGQMIFSIIKPILEKNIAMEIKGNIENIIKKSTSAFKEVAQQAVEEVIESWGSTSFNI